MFKLGFICLYFIAFSSLSCQLDVRLEQFSPESQKSKQNNWVGIDIELTQALLNEAECSFNVLEVSWARALIMLTSGKLDLILNMSKTSEREKDYYFIGPIRNETIVFATYENNRVPINTIEDIVKLDKPIAIQRNAYYGEEIQYYLQHKYYKESFVHVANNETKLRLLKRGRISGFLEAKRNIIHGINNDENYKGVWFPDVIIHQNPTYFAFSKKSINKALKQKISEGFSRLVARGEIDKIIKKHQGNRFSMPITQEK
jgi:polar amino acid transport system substrate-binding protein